MANRKQKVLPLSVSYNFFQFLIRFFKVYIFHFYIVLLFLLIVLKLDHLVRFNRREIYYRSRKRVFIRSNWMVLIVHSSSVLYNIFISCSLIFKLFIQKVFRKFYCFTSFLLLVDWLKIIHIYYFFIGLLLLYIWSGEAES